MCCGVGMPPAESLKEGSGEFADSPGTRTESGKTVESRSDPATLLVLCALGVGAADLCMHTHKSSELHVGYRGASINLISPTLMKKTATRMQYLRRGVQKRLAQQRDIQ